MQQFEINAIKSFHSDYNCAQSVLLAYAPDLNIDVDLLLGLSSGFGAGMARLQETCGAVTGAYMVIGLYNRKRYTNNSTLKEASYLMIQKFNADFISYHGTTKCKVLLNCELNSVTGQEYSYENKLNINVCEKCIIHSINIIDKLIKE